MYVIMVCVVVAGEPGGAHPQAGEEAPWHIFYGVYLVTHMQLKTRTHLTNGVVSDSE